MAASVAQQVSLGTYVAILERGIRRLERVSAEVRAAQKMVEDEVMDLAELRNTIFASSRRARFEAEAEVVIGMLHECGCCAKSMLDPKVAPHDLILDARALLDDAKMMIEREPGVASRAPHALLATRLMQTATRVREAVTKGRGVVRCVKTHSGKRIEIRRSMRGALVAEGLLSRGARMVE